MKAGRAVGLEGISLLGGKDQILDCRGIVGV